MGLATTLFVGLLFHLIGDFLYQTHEMAINKTKSWKYAILHVSVYTILFTLIMPSWVLSIVFITHLLIDRFRLAEYWIRLINNNWDWENKNWGYPADTPLWLSTWLMIIIDQVMHISINSACIVVHFKLFEQ